MRPQNKWMMFPLMLTLMSATSGAWSAEHSVRLSAYLADIATLSGQFEQISVDAGTGFTSHQTGSLWIAKPNRFRLVTIEPSAQTLVSNGADFWVYDQALEQVIISKLNTDINQVPVLLFAGSSEEIEQAYTVSGYLDEAGEYFLLEPRTQSSLFSSLSLDFRAGIPHTIRINAANGQLTTINLGQVLINETIAAHQFVFEIPADVDVIDDR